MIRKYKKTLIFTTLLTLLPIVIGLILWNKLPDSMVIHWGAGGQPDGAGSKATAVFVMPLILVAVHWLCVFAAAKDPGNKNRNQKMQGVVLWCVPLLANVVCGIMYALALGVDFSITNAMLVFLGLLFAVIGNYMPKCRMNSTIGIKIRWTYTSEENWNATHRFAGKVWFAGGLLVALSALLPVGIYVWVLLPVMLVLAIVPMVYSWCYYRKQVERGDTLMEMPVFTKKARNISRVILIPALAVLAVVMFSGSISVELQEDSFTVDASFSDAITVGYDTIDTVEYREGNMDGVRVWGFASMKLLLGEFENKEFGNYTRYTYCNSGACIVLTSGEKVLVISGKDAAETKTLYEALTEKIN
jgi:uncharacterized membrane protein